jgi:hypothetical protein
MVLSLTPEHLARRQWPCPLGSLKLGSSSPRPDTLTRFETGHLRRRLFGAGRKSSAPAFPVSHASFLERFSTTGMRLLMGRVKPFEAITIKVQLEISSAVSGSFH